MKQDAGSPPSARIGSWATIAATFATIAMTMLLLDLVWLGLVARDFYDSQLGSLKRPDVYWPAAVLFYAMYITSILAYAVVGSATTIAALRRGAALGFVTYATYELTNWAVIRDWPAALVPVDLLWGVVLTAVAGFAGKGVHLRLTAK